ADPPPDPRPRAERPRRARPCRAGARRRRRLVPGRVDRRAQRRHRGARGRGPRPRRLGRGRLPQARGGRPARLPGADGRRRLARARARRRGPRGPGVRRHRRRRRRPPPDGRLRLGRRALRRHRPRRRPAHPAHGAAAARARLPRGARHRPARRHGHQRDGLRRVHRQRRRRRDPPLGLDVGARRRRPRRQPGPGRRRRQRAPADRRLGRGQRRRDVGREPPRRPPPRLRPAHHRARALRGAPGGLAARLRRRAGRSRRLAGHRRRGRRVLRVGRLAPGLRRRLAHRGPAARRLPVRGPGPDRHRCPVGQPALRDERPRHRPCGRRGGGLHGGRGLPRQDGRLHAPGAPRRLGQRLADLPGHRGRRAPAGRPRVAPRRRRLGAPDHPGALQARREGLRARDDGVGARVRPGDRRPRDHRRQERRLRHRLPAGPAGVAAPRRRALRQAPGRARRAEHEPVPAQVAAHPEVAARLGAVGPAAVQAVHGRDGDRHDHRDPVRRPDAPLRGRAQVARGVDRPPRPGRLEPRALPAGRPGGARGPGPRERHPQARPDAQGRGVGLRRGHGHQDDLRRLRRPHRAGHGEAHRAPLQAARDLHADRAGRGPRRQRDTGDHPPAHQEV
ncbi:MAG: hypothetical protein AVDCRST_MAG30-4681, partial [uncultured Solirubrobacteraceae bacterium]